MFSVIRSLFVMISLLFSMGTVFAISTPFTDIQTTDPYYSAISELYEGRVISDNGDHLFHPADLMNRDFFVSLAVGIGCHNCETPSIEDIIKYQISPFIDLSKINRYYYCIAYGEDNSIIQGYITDTSGKASCEDNKQYMSSPFCAENTITRIEATAILLRRAHLWDDTLNSGNFDRSNSIPDTSSYWYGYAKKGIEMEIIKQRSDKKIGQDEKITRGEFAMMAARILKYTQCRPANSTNTIAAEIIVQDQNGVLVPKTVFNESSLDVLAVIPTGDWIKKWTLTNPITKEILTGSGDTYPIKNLKCGTWINTVELINRINQQIVSTASNTITIECNNQLTSYPISVSISANPLIAKNGLSIEFGSIVHGGSGTLTYNWDSGDGTTSTKTNTISHVYKTNGAYTVTLTITDTIGNVARSSLVVKIEGESDTDGDGLIDTIDQCPLVYAKTVTGCPLIITYSPLNTSRNSIAAEIGIKNNTNILVNKSSFNLGEIFYLIPITNIGTWNYNWNATNITTGITLSKTGSVFPGTLFDNLGDWKVTLEIIDPKTGNIVASPRMTLDIHSTDITSNIDLSPCAHITANPLILTVGSIITLNPTVCSHGIHPLTYLLNYGDNQTTTDIKNTTHTYTTTGIYTITLSVTDTITKKIGDASVIIKVEPQKKNPDKKTISVHISAIPGIVEINTPITFTPTVTRTGTNPLEYTWDFKDGETGNTQGVTTHTYTTPNNKYLVTLNIKDTITGEVSTASTTINTKSATSSITNNLAVSVSAIPGIVEINTPITFTPTVTRTGTNPLEYTWDFKDGETGNTQGITTHTYTTPNNKYLVTLNVKDTITGEVSTASTTINTKEAVTTTFQPQSTGGSNNTCLDKYRKIQGLLIGNAFCSTCPCSNSISIDSPLRSCDIVFPTILSPSLNTIYSRGGFYLIP